MTKIKQSAYGYFERGNDMNRTILLNELGVSEPIFLAGMAGGVTTPKLVSEVCNAGGLGQIGAGYMNPESLSDDIDKIRKMTDKPFGVNLFIPEFPEINQDKVDRMNAILKPIEEELQYEPIKEVKITYQFDEMIDVIIDKEVKVASFTFGKPTEALVSKLHRHKILVLGTATELEEALDLVKVGVDGIVLQGKEAGGHRGSFKQSLPDDLLTTEQLFNLAKESIDLPLIVAGGITNPERSQFFLQKGATAVQLGTAFLTTEESGVPNIHKESILRATTKDIVLTNTFSGRYANGIRNAYIVYAETFERAICPYPIQNILTQPMRGKSKKEDNPDYMNLWCGTNPEGAKREKAQDLIKRYTEK